MPAPTTEGNMPNNPGFLTERIYWIYVSLILNRCRGRGPKTAISPLRIFQTWGISSRPVFRRILPTEVILSPSSIVLNFQIINSLPWKPTRVCLKKTGPFELSLMGTANTAATAAAAGIPKTQNAPSAAIIYQRSFKTGPALLPAAAGEEEETSLLTSFVFRSTLDARVDN